MMRISVNISNAEVPVNGVGVKPQSGINKAEALTARRAALYSVCGLTPTPFTYGGQVCSFSKKINIPTH